MELSFLQLSIAIIALTALAQTSLAVAVAGNTVMPPLQKQPSYKSDSVKEFLAGHNAARAAIGVPPLTWNATVAAYAEVYAAKRSADCALEHSEGPYGENIAEGYGELSAADSVNMWVGEKPNYDYPSNSCVGGECLHYTQVVWRNTASIGCARAACKNGWMFVTCNYYPPGNYIGERPY